LIDVSRTGIHKKRIKAIGNYLDHRVCYGIVSAPKIAIQENSWFTTEEMNILIDKTGFFLP
jgi:hypothetical protein